MGVVGVIPVEPPAVLVKNATDVVYAAYLRRAVCACEGGAVVAGIGYGARIVKSLGDARWLRSRSMTLVS